MAKLTKDLAQTWLANVPDGKQFWCQDSRVFVNLQELQVGLTNMPVEVFKSHVNEAKNDFVNWVKDVIGDEDLAKELKKNASVTGAARAVNNRVAALKRAAGVK